MIPDDFTDLLQEKNFGNLATINPDGSPHVTPVWVDYDETNGYILFNTAKGRKKHRNIQKRKDVAISIMDQENPYRYLMVEGKIVEITEEGAEEHIHSLAQKYMGKERYPIQEGNTRIKVAIKPEKYATMG